MEEESSRLGTQLNSAAVLAFIVSMIGLVSLVIAYWLILPAVVLGLLAVVLGVIGRRRASRGQGQRDIAVAAIVLGIVAILATPWVKSVEKISEDYGRQCALNPSDPDC